MSGEDHEDLKSSHIQVNNAALEYYGIISSGTTAYGTNGQNIFSHGSPVMQTTVQHPTQQIQYKYNENKIIEDLKNYIDQTYSEHYTSKESSIQAFDAWIARGDSTPTFVNTALKYLWRYGKKNGNNKTDLMKALHYIVLAMYVDHYKGK